MKRLKLLGMAVLLIVPLVVFSSCTAFASVPPDEAVKLAIAQQLTHTQQTLAQALGFESTPAPNFKIDSFTVKSREKLNSSEFSRNDIPGELYRVRGTFATALTAPALKAKEVVQQNSPFEIYLASEPQPPDSDSAHKVQTWYLVNSPTASLTNTPSLANSSLANSSLAN